MTGKFGLCCATALVLISAMTAQSFAQEEKTQTEEQETKSSPLLINADELRYEDQNQTIIASGNVEIFQGDTILHADKIKYDQSKGIVTASGNIQIIERSGNVVFADEIELTDDLKQGFVDSIQVLFTNDAKFAAASGDLNENVTTLSKAVYSPCKICAEDKNPLWSIRADKIYHDKKKKDVIYKNARFEVLGVPIAYTPYFSHPDPTVERRTGFLTPRFGSDSELGTFFTNDFYVDIDQDKDLTLSPFFSEEDGLLLGGEWRQRFEKGALKVNGAGVVADRTLSDGTVDNDTFRGYLFATAQMDLTDDWRSGLEVQTTTDDDFLRRYNISDEDILRSRLYVEYLHDRDYADISGYYFEDLRPEATEDAPLAVPIIQWEKYGQPGQLLGGRWVLGLDTAKLERGDEETDSFRFSTKLGWQKETFHQNGVITSLELQNWIEGFSAQNIALTGGGTTDTDDIRVQPIGQIKARLPISKNISDTLNHYIEPTVAFTATTTNANDAIVPNEDSRDTEFDHTNIFSLNRYTGRDRVETGQWLSWGVRTGLNDFELPENDFFSFAGGEASIFLGQSYHFDNDNDFAQGSGLEGKTSDYVGNINIRPNNILNIDYSFRLDDDDFRARKHDVDLSLNFDRFTFNTEYLFLDDSIVFDDLEDREEITFGMTYDRIENWKFAGEYTRDLSSNGGTVDSALSITYYNECVAITLAAKRDGTDRTDISSGNSVSLTLDLLSLGNTNPAVLSQDLFGDQ